MSIRSRPFMKDAFKIDPVRLDVGVSGRNKEILDNLDKGVSS